MIVGETISHYRVLKLLGAGGMGEVYQAEDTRLKRLVALKFLPPALVQDRDAKERLVHEAQAASALDHPNICTIHEIDETPDGRLFVAMAYYEGETLKERIARAPFTIEQATDVIAQIARAVAAAHAAGMVHRDIKPANVILTPKGEVKLLDFGIAKLPGQTALTRTGTTVGTVAYMSPEQIAGHGADERSDTWALGVVLYEMLAGGLPFGGGNELAIMRAIADTEPRAVGTVRAGVPPSVDAIVARALQKEQGARYPSAREFLEQIEALRAPTAPLTATTGVAGPTPRMSGRQRLTIAAVVLLTMSLSGWFVYRQARVRSARRTLQHVVDLVSQERFSDAYLLLRRVEPQLSGDSDFARVRDSFLLPVSIRTDPPGADVYIRAYDDTTSPWDYLGRTPLDTRGVIAYFKWRVTKPGFTPFEGAAGLAPEATFALLPEGSVPDDMVHVRGDVTSLPSDGGVRVGDFFIDRYEVTNREFKRFVDARGYRDHRYWTEPFIKDGHALSWEEAMAEFRDATGRPGPSTWELGTYPDGQDNYPVRGVSWYEAAAFARFADKMLPTVYHWRRAADVSSVFSNVLELSNFSSKGPARVGEFKGLGAYGTYDMAGNVKEWCWNAVGAKRYILGGAWNEPNYQFTLPDARAPFDRSPNNGFRTARSTDASAWPETARRPIERLGRDYEQEKPAADDLFRAHASLYSYDHTDLKASVESVDDGAPAWRVERVTYAAAYGDERIVAYLFVPKNSAAPHQTVVYFPHSGGFTLRSFQQGEMSYLGFIVKAGRALFFPMYKGTYERRIAAPPSGPNAVRDVIVQQIKDLQRSVDYLQTRGDLAGDKLAYFGVSYGAALAPIALAVEKRFKSAVVWSGGLRVADTGPYNRARPLPETDPFDFAPHVTTPVLMLNGRDDFTYPIDSSQLPMFRLLGTPEKDKKRVLYDGGHVFPFARVEKDTLDWLDRYLGAPH